MQLRGLVITATKKERTRDTSALC